MGTPLTSSMTKYGRPDGVAPPSSTLAMFGWSMIASACRSASKRATTCRVSMPGLRTFRATLRRTGCVCSAMKTTPKPPFADLLQQLVGADDRARPLGGRVIDRGGGMNPPLAEERRVLIGLE